MNSTDYPALYQSADNASNGAQSKFIKLVFVYYFLLVLATALSAYHDESRVLLFVISSLIMVSATCIVCTLFFLTPEKAWYRSRALAESVKTATWRFMMRAEPFEDCATATIAEKKFSDFLKQILESNEHVGNDLSNYTTELPQISERMKKIRAEPIEHRLSCYLNNRLSEQKKWYVKKSKYNKYKHTFWIVIIVIINLVGLIFMIMRIWHPNLWHFFPVEPILMIASSIFGWLQIKKFGELSASYSLTANEIGIAESKKGHLRNEQEFSDFVNDTEFAFSREHTQWIARQHDPIIQ